MHIVITGGMGCGKSTITKYLKSRLPDYHFFDMDEQVRNLYDNEQMKKNLVFLFGTHNRREISDLVFANPIARERLYGLMNDTIFDLLHRHHQHENVIYDIPLYFEMREQLEFVPDEVICVICSPETQRARIKSRDGFSDEKISSILALQLPLREKAFMSDYVIETDGTPEESIDQLERILKFTVDYTY